jgi:hypothetical protein
MSRVPPGLLGVVLALLAAGSAAAQAVPPEQLPPTDQTSSALLRFVRERLAQVPGLRPADGVQVEQAQFDHGTLYVRGSVASADQRDAVRREIEALRPRLEVAADVSALQVNAAAAPQAGGDSAKKTAEPERLRPTPQPGPADAPAACPPADGCPEGVGEQSCPLAAPMPRMPPPPPFPWRPAGPELPYPMWGPAPGWVVPADDGCGKHPLWKLFHR